MLDKLIKLVATCGKDSVKGVRPAKKKRRGRGKKSHWLHAVNQIFCRCVAPLTLFAAGMGTGAVDEGLWVTWAFISSSKPPSEPPILVYYKTNATVGASVLSPQHSQTRVAMTQLLMAISSLWGRSKGIWGIWCWRVVMEPSIKASSGLLQFYCPFKLGHFNGHSNSFMVWSPLWCHLHQVKVTQLDLKLWLWEDMNSPCSWVGIYKSCLQRCRNWYSQKRS